MSRFSPQSAQSMGSVLFIALFLVVSASVQFAVAGLDEGEFDLSQSPQGPPTAWAWCPNSTSDGDGYAFIAYLGSFQHAGPGQPSVTTTTNYTPGTGHQSLQDFVNWVVANNPNVSSSADLTIVRHDVSLVSIP